jgi:microcystin degradation protein MlrC
MKKILIAAFKQETSTFNPTRTTYDLFNVLSGNELFNLRGTNTEIAGALDVFDGHNDVEVIPTYSASSVSGGPVLEADLNRITAELLAAVRNAPQVDGMYMVFHGAMAGEIEMDPEGRVLVGLREILGDIPIVTTYDLHGVITDRLVEHSDIMAPFHTYPHIDMYETGQRGATALLRLLQDQVKPTLAHVKIPMLVRGDELITATGRFGQAIQMCQEIEASENGLAAGVYIGNPFTDVPALQSNVIVVTDNDPEYAQSKAQEIAQFMWDNRERFKAPLTSIEDAIRLATETEGITIFSDAADATSSGASGDSNAILKGLIQHNYQGKALLPIVDAPAVQVAMQAGIGETITVPIGGTIDQGRHSPVEIEATVKLLSDGEYKSATGTAGHAGPTAVLVCGTYTLMVTTKPVSIMDQHVFRSRGIDPEDFNLVVCKSPNGFRVHYEAIAERIVPVDAPGSTSANLLSLPYEKCVRPIFPLDDNVQPTFETQTK